jgi:hypothetical protein
MILRGSTAPVTCIGLLLAKVYIVGQVRRQNLRFCCDASDFEHRRPYDCFFHWMMNVVFTVVLQDNNRAI